jgi:hypothetical protein
MMRLILRGHFKICLFPRALGIFAVSQVAARHDEYSDVLMHYIPVFPRSHVPANNHPKNGFVSGSSLARDGKWKAENIHAPR